MMKLTYKHGFYILLFLVFVLVLASCSTRDQARWEGTIDLGPLPEDMLYVDGVPQFNISTESDGDLVLSYTSTNGNAVGQLYGCAVISINCGKLYKQGNYTFSIPDKIKKSYPELYK